MEQEEMNKQQQDHDQRRRLKHPMLSENQQQPPNHQRPQKCPRCESLNTKFCYYNNYSHSQPRYFCKTCRRYWTQGGTLRNVPVGGGCRKGKRAKTSSSPSGENSRSHTSPPPKQLQLPQNMATMVSGKELGNLGLPVANLPASSYYSSGIGFLSSLAAMQSLNRPQLAFNQSPLQFNGASNMALLQGFNDNIPSFRAAPQPQNQQQSDHKLYQVAGNRDKNIEMPFYPSDQSLAQPNRPLGSSWTQNFINNKNSNPSASNTTNFWNSTISGGASESSLNPNQWPDLPGFGPPT